MAAFCATPDFGRIMAGIVQGALAAQAAPASAPPANQRRGGTSTTIATLGNTSGSSGGASVGVSVLKQRIEDLTKQVAALAATNLKQLELITELTRQLQPAAQRPGGPAAQ